MDAHQDDPFDENRSSHAVEADEADEPDQMTFRRANPVELPLPPARLTVEGSVPFSADVEVDHIMPTSNNQSSKKKEFNPSQDHHKSLDTMAYRPQPFHQLDNPSLLERPSLKPNVALAVVNQPPKSVHSPHDFKVLPIPGYYNVDKSTHFAVSGLAVALLASQTLEFLDKHKVDFDAKPHISRWDCCTASNASHLEFYVRIWARDSESVFEFVHQNGDQTRFAQLFKQFRALLTNESVVAEHSFQPLAYTQPNLQPNLDCEALVCQLVEMVGSFVPDSALEGTRGLVHLSTDKDLRLAFQRLDVITKLVHFLTADHVQDPEDHTWMTCRLFSITCLANLSEEPMMWADLEDAAVLLVELVDEGSFQDRAMRREATRTLRNLAQDTRGADRIIQKVGKGRLENLCQTVYPNLVDIQMQHDVAAIKANLERRWQEVA